MIYTMKKSLKRTVVWVLIVLGGILYVKFGVSPPKRLSHIEIQQRQSCEMLESIARDMKAYIKEHNGLRPTNFICLAEIDPKYKNIDSFANYRIQVNKKTEILVSEKPGLWEDKTIAVYFNGKLGASRIDEHTYYRLLDNTIDIQELRKRLSGQ